MLPVMIDIRPAGSRQSIPVARLEQRFRSPRVRPCDGFGCRVVDVVVVVHVAVGREEQIPGSLAVHEVGRFDDAFVRGALVVEDGGGGAEEGDAVVAEALDAQRGGDYGCDCEVLGQNKMWLISLGRRLLTSVAASSAVADGVAVDLPDEVALAVVVVCGSVNRAALG